MGIPEVVFSLVILTMNIGFVFCCIRLYDELIGRS